MRFIRSAFNRGFYDVLALRPLRDILRRPWCRLAHRARELHDHKNRYFKYRCRICGERWVTK